MREKRLLSLACIALTGILALTSCVAEKPATVSPPLLAAVEPEAETPEPTPQEGEVLFDNGEVTYYVDIDDDFVISGYSADADYIAYHGFLYITGGQFLGEELAHGEGDARWGNEEKTVLNFGWRSYYPLEEEKARELDFIGVPEINWSFQIDLESETVSGRSRGASEYAEPNGKANADDLTDEELVEIGKKLAKILSDADEFRERQRAGGLEEPPL